MDLQLSETEARVLGSLIEKKIITPGVYPLTLNALTTACNQTSARDPVMNLTMEQVEEAIGKLQRKDLVRLTFGDRSRTERFEHRFTEMFSLPRRQEALLCILMLRGAQTLGELHSRTSRLCTFSSLAEVEQSLKHLNERAGGPLATMLPRRPGQKENRYTHCFFGDSPAAAAAETSPEGTKTAPPHTTPERSAVLLKNKSEDTGALVERIGQLEHEIATLKRQMAVLEERFEGIRRTVDR